MDMLSLSAHLPQIEVAPGDVLVHEGGVAGAIWVLLEGSLRVRKGETQVNTIVQPGAIIGEISVLLGTSHGATVEAIEPSRLRYAEDGREFLDGNGAITREIAIGLAERLNYVTAYLADLKHQYGEAPGLAMVGQVLTRLANQQGVVAQPGSARDPDPEY